MPALAKTGQTPYWRGMDAVTGDAAEGPQRAAASEDASAAVHVGRNGWLFLTGGTPRVPVQYRPHPDGGGTNGRGGG